MKHTILILLIISFIDTCAAQTKLIAHKSHSGNSLSFSELLKSNNPALKTSNFGHQIQPEVKTARLDSLIFVNDTCQIMVTSEICTDRFGGEAITQEWNHQKNVWQKAIEVSKDKKSSVWKAGRDTVYHHALFSQNESLDYVKTVLKDQYHFKNEIENVVFIGYTNNSKAFPVSEASIKVKIIDAEKGIIDLVLNGRFSNFWLCYQTHAIVGIEKKNDDNSTWVKIYKPENNPKHKKITNCESPYTQFKNETMKDIFRYYKFRSEMNNKSHELPGTYRFFVEIYDTKKTIYSNEFTIKS